MTMSTVFDNPAVGVAVVVLAAILLFLPSFVAHFRKIQAFRSVSALNALTLFLLLFAFPLWFSKSFFRAALAVWGVATVWSIAGRRRVGYGPILKAPASDAEAGNPATEKTAPNAFWT
jgi:hypothetical protein